MRLLYVIVVCFGSIFCSLCSPYSLLGQTFKYYDSILESQLAPFLRDSNILFESEEIYPGGLKQRFTSIDSTGLTLDLYLTHNREVWDIGLAVDSSFYQTAILKPATIEEKIFSSAMWYVNFASKDLLINWLSLIKPKFSNTIGATAEIYVEYILEQRKSTSFLSVTKVEIKPNAAKNADCIEIEFSAGSSTTFQMIFPIKEEAAMRGNITIYANSALALPVDSTLLWAQSDSILTICSFECSDSKRFSKSPSPFKELAESITLEKEIAWNTIEPHIQQIRLMSWNQEEMKFGQTIPLSNFARLWNKLYSLRAFCGAGELIDTDGSDFIIRWTAPTRENQSMLYFTQGDDGWILSLVY